MARPPRKTEIPAETKINEQAVKQATATLDEASALARNHQIALVHTLGEVANYAPEQLWGEVKFYANSLAASVLHLGVRLLALKEKLPYGEFTAGLEAHGFAPRTARVYMTAAVKFGQSKKDMAAILQLPVTKVLALATLPDEELEALAEGKTVANLRLDDLDAMSGREVRAKCREILAEKAAVEKVLAEKSQLVDKYEIRLSKEPVILPFSNFCAALIERSVRSLLEFENAGMQLTKLIEEAQKGHEEVYPPTEEELDWFKGQFEGALARMEEATSRVREALNQL